MPFSVISRYHSLSQSNKINNHPWSAICSASSTTLEACGAAPYSSAVLALRTAAPVGHVRVTEWLLLYFVCARLVFAAGSLHANMHGPLTPSPSHPLSIWWVMCHTHLRSLETTAAIVAPFQGGPMHHRERYVQALRQLSVQHREVGRAGFQGGLNKHTVLRNAL